MADEEEQKDGAESGQESGADSVQESGQDSGQESGQDSGAVMSILGRLQRNFLTGLVVVLPVLMTIYLIWSVAGFFDARILPLIPTGYNPQDYFDSNFRGFGIIVFLVFTTLIGAIFKGFFGRQVLRLGEAVVGRVPIVRTIYNGTKQIVETVTSSSQSKFEHACMIEYPRKGIWAVGFVVTETRGEVLRQAGQAAMCSVFLPTTPNPTSGFLLFVPRKDVIFLDMDVEAAAKLVISAGLVTPEDATRMPSAVEKIPAEVLARGQKTTERQVLTEPANGKARKPKGRG